MSCAPPEGQSWPNVRTDADVGVRTDAFGATDPIRTNGVWGQSR